ncbi:hypothetical protein [Flagellimonas eckloniae]|uniref:Uncharacterized protein n=1 Tax=Flagellimonas eckloniae TaxID=346185 RepID=A0A0Q1CD69_9FLAO|nr:hypothetical protein [Allomuricauda eckloniae]KQC28618.1 hypothetical protein AAY42_00885 [Allomuricauda eckloniae]
MIYLNFTHLDKDTQEHLLSRSRSNIETKYGEQLKRYAQENDIDLEALLEETCPERDRGKAQRNLYAYEYICDP